MEAESGCQGLGEGADEEQLRQGHVVRCGGGWKRLAVDRGGACTPL